MAIGGSGKEEAQKAEGCGIGCKLRKMVGMQTAKEAAQEGKEKGSDVKLRQRMREAGAE